jgi:hypothetical protein
MASGNSFEQKPKRRRGPGKPFVKGLSGNGFGTPFKPGVSGNPSGKRKACQDVQALARTHTPEAIEALVAALAYPRERVAAAVALLDRGWGKPTVVVAGDGERPIAIDFTWADATPVTPNGEAEYVGRDITSPAATKAKSAVIDAVLAESNPPAAPLVIEWESSDAADDAGTTGILCWKQ